MADGARNAMVDHGTETRARQWFQHLRETGFDGVGITRESYGAGETAALDYFAEQAQEAGLQVRRDAAANLVVELPGQDAGAPAVVAGSHLDSVPHGGNYDGAAGFIAALLALIHLKEKGARPRHPVWALGLRGEESAWYGPCYIGSLALTGRLPAADLKATHRKTGAPLSAAMAAVGVDVARVAAGEVLLKPERLRCFIELHIEQGPVMVARNMPVAMVTGIRGNIRHRQIVCRGEAGHSGAVPRWLRRDAVLATVELLSRMDEHWRVLQERGLDLVMTTGMISTNPEEHAMSRIPGECRFSFEVRSQSVESLEAFHHLFETEARAVGEQRKVDFEMDVPVHSAPAVLDRDILTAMRRAFEVAGVPPEAIPSGAGHDAAVFANAGVAAGMIFVRNQNGSHNPLEDMDMDDFLLAARLLEDTLAELAG